MICSITPALQLVLGLHLAYELHLVPGPHLPFYLHLAFDPNDDGRVGIYGDLLLPMPLDTANGTRDCTRVPRHHQIL